jgi:hypothetical protein
LLPQPAGELTPRRIGYFPGKSRRREAAEAHGARGGVNPFCQLGAVQALTTGEVAVAMSQRAVLSSTPCSRVQSSFCRA